jgi:K+-sensing histidine kinase KdpD
MALPITLMSRPISGLAGARERLAHDRTTMRRYAVAVAVTGVAVLGVLAIDHLVHLRTNVLLVTAVVIAAWYGGRGPGALASILCVFAVDVLFGRSTSPAALDVPGVGEATYLVTFLLVALIIGATTESLRRERARAVERATQLEDLNAEVEAQMEEVQTLSEHLQESNESLSDALDYAQDLAARSRRLQEATAGLARAQTENEVADVVLGKGLAAAGATRGILARLDADRVEIVRASGYAPDVEARLVGPPTEIPALVQAARTGEPVWVRSAEEHLARYGQLYARVGITSVPHASVSIPLRYGGEVVGAISLVFVEPSTFDSATEAISLMLGQAAADALGRARSFDAERAAREQAETIAQARADVLGIVAHDLRNPLSLIASGASLLLEIEDQPLAQRRKVIEVTQRAVRQMNRLIADLLDATRVQAGRLTLDLHDVDARALVRQAEETLRPAAQENRIELRAEAPEHESIVHVDEGRLLQVLGNLVGNAIKFVAPGGRVLLTARPDTTEVVFSVTDNGPGIPPENLNQLFGRFWQARRGDRRGVGLGLAIAKGLVEAHGGRIWVESAIGLGSTFSFAIPSCHSPTMRQGRGDESLRDRYYGPGADQQLQ